MASDEEDEELHALRLAVLQSMKNKLAAEEEPKPCKEVVVSVRDAALPTIQQHAIVTQVQQVMSSSPWNNPHSNSPKYAQSNFHGNFHQGGFRGRPARNSNLIVINPAPMEQPVKEAPRISTTTTTTNKPMLIRPQDKWCASDTRPVTVEQPKKEKASSKFSRFDTSDSDSSDYSSSSSDSEEEEKEKVLSPVHKSDKGSDSDNFDLESDIETQIDNILNDSVKKTDKKEVMKEEKKLSPELPKQSATINLPHKETAEAPKKQVVEPLKKQTIEVPKKNTVTKIEAKPIPTLTNMCRNKPVKKESNCWSDSDSDTVTNSLPKSKNKRSWSDEGSSDENQVPKASKEGKTALSSLSKLSEVTKTNKSEIEKLELKRTLENDLQKTLNALQTIKEKRQKQEAARKSTLPDVTSSEKSNKDSPHLKRKSPRSISPSSSRSPSRLSQHKQPYSPYKSSSGRRSPSPRRKRSLSPRRRRSLSRSHSRSPLPRRRRSPSPRHSRSPLPRRRRSPSPSHSRSPLPRRRRSPSPRHSRSPLLTKHRKSPSSRHSKSPDTRRNRSPALRGSTSRSPSRRREKRILTSEERRKIEARRAKFENREIVPIKKTVSLKGITRRSKSKEKIHTENSESLIKSGKPKVNRTQAKRKSRESKENENSDSESSVSSVSDNDSSDDEDRSWRKEQNQNKHAEIRKRVVTARENVLHDRKPREDRKPHEERNITKPKGENGTSKNKSSRLTNRNYSHIYSDNIDRGFDATNYRKTDVTQKSASDDSDSDDKSKNKKLVSVVLLNKNKNVEEPSPTRKVERSETASKSPRQDRDRSKILKIKRKVITDDNLPFTKKPKNEDIRDASELLQGVRNRKKLSRKAVFHEDGHNSLSITVQDKNSNNESPPKPSVHERLGRKVPSLMSLSIKSDDFVKVSKRDPSPEYYDSKVKIFTKDNDSSYETRKSKSRSDDKKRKRVKRSVIDEDETTELQDGPDDALEKRIQMIKEKNAAILKRQAEIQKDKEKFG